MINVGKVDRILRFGLGVFLGWLGLFGMDGLQGNVVGILIAVASILPFYMAISRACFVFKWFKIDSLSKSERETLGDPYEE